MRRRHPLMSRRGDRHRSLRSQVQGPQLPALETKRDHFYTIVSDAAAYVVSDWRDELEGVRLEIADVPSQELATRTGQRWSTDRRERRIVLYRLPIQRAGLMRGLDATHRRMLVEYYVFVAFADYLGKEPWELSPERYHPF